MRDSSKNLRVLWTRALLNTLGKIEDDIGRIVKKLDNEKFVANAKPEVVEAEREKLVELETQKAQVAQALARVRDAG